MTKRSKMFSCRLSEDEYEKLVDLLDICESSANEFVQNKFRNFIKVLHGRLYTDYFGYLRLKPKAGELTENEMQKLQKDSHQSLYERLYRS